MELDNQDLEILKTLYQLGNPSPKKIADNLDVPQSTVHYRLKRLREEGIIKNELYEFDGEKAGIDVTIISEVVAEYEEGYQDQVGAALGDIDGVSQVFFTLGDTDFIVVAKLPNSDAVQQLVNSYESVEGVKRTSSRFVINTMKDEPNPIRNYDIESLEEFGLSSDGADGEK